MTEHARHPDGTAVACLLSGDLQNRRPTGVGRLTPIKGGMSVEDLQAAHQQHGDRNHIDPVHDPHGQAVAKVTVVLDTGAPDVVVGSDRGMGVRRANCDRIACREGHVECLVETRVERLFGLGFLGHAVQPL